MAEEVSLPEVGSTRWFLSADNRGADYDMSDRNGRVEVANQLLHYVGTEGHALVVRGTDASNYGSVFVAWPHELHAEAPR